MFSILLDIVIFLPLALLAATSITSTFIRKCGPYHGIPPGRSLYYFSREYLYLLIYCAIYVLIDPFDRLLRHRNKDILSVSGGERMAVFVHGLFASPAQWLWQSFLFKKHGFSHAIRFSYKTGLPPDETAKKLAEILEETDAVSIVLIGHSMGGLIAIHAAAMLPEAKIARVITLGTPFRGTLMARFAASANGKALVPDTPLVEKNLEIARRLGEKLTCIWSQSDPLIIPPQSASPEPATCVEIEGAGHTGYHFIPILGKLAEEQKKSG